MSPDKEINPKTGRTVADDLRKKLNLLLWLNGILAIGLIVAVVYFGIQASQSHTALCNLRADQVRRLATSREFLRVHPNGTRDIPKGVVEQAIKNASITSQSLEKLGCSEVIIVN